MLTITTTTGDRSTADRIATELVGRKLAACVQISGPLSSTYNWKGKVETTEEWICTAKTIAAHFEAIELLIGELHPYDTPELIGTPITHASAAYENWLRGEVE